MTQKENEWEKDFDKQFPLLDDLEVTTLPNFSIEDKALRQTRLLALNQHNTKLRYLKDFIRQLRTDTIRQTIEECIEALPEMPKMAKNLVEPGASFWAGYGSCRYQIRAGLRQKLTSNE